MGGGQPLGPVALRERDEVGDLLPLQVNDLHQLARPGGKGRAVPARNQELPPQKIRPRRFGRWPRRAVCLPGRHGSFITHGEDCASYAVMGQANPSNVRENAPPGGWVSRVCLPAWLTAPIWRSETRASVRPYGSATSRKATKSYPVWPGLKSSGEFSSEHPTTTWQRKRSSAGPVRGLPP